MNTGYLDGEELALEQVQEVSEGRARIRVHPSVKDRVKSSRDFVARKSKRSTP